MGEQSRLRGAVTLLVQSVELKGNAKVGCWIRLGSGSQERANVDVQKNEPGQGKAAE